MTTDREKIDISLGEAANRYLTTIPKNLQVTYQQEIFKFVRWFGNERTMIGIAASEVSNYAERLAQMDTDAATKLEPIRAFLAYVRKEKWNPDNLAIGIKVKKSKSRNTGPAQKVNREPIPMTKAKYDELADEMKKLQAKRVDVIVEIQRAAADKDFRENVPFHAAREKRGHMEGRIMELEATLREAIIIGENKKAETRVNIGDSVIVCEVNSEEETCYTLVSPKEVDIKKGKISSVSPMGKAILGREAGETIEIHAPVGKLHYRIKRIQH